MSDRATVTLGAAPPSPAASGPQCSRAIFAGQTQFGPVGAPVICRSMRDYTNMFGARSGGAAMYDAAEFFLSQGGGELVVQRASGPSAVLATVSLSAGAIVVTAKNPGAYYNAYTAAYTTATKTLTLVKGSKTITYTGADAAGLQSAASVDPDVTVTVTSLPGSNVAATNLASGTDDYASVNWTTVLGKIPTFFGSGAVATPGVTASATALTAHAAAAGRLALLSTAQGEAFGTTVTNQNALAANRQFGSYVAGWGAVSDQAGGLKPVDAVVRAATVRAVAMRVFGEGTIPILAAANALVTGWTPLTEPTAAEQASMEAAGVIYHYTTGSGVTIGNWQTADPVNNYAAMRGAQYRDLVNAAAADLRQIGLNFAGLGGSAIYRRQLEVGASGALNAYARWLAAWRVSADPGVSPADNRIALNAALQFTEFAEWVDISLLVAAPDQTI